MADELVRVKIEDGGGNGVEGALIRIFDEDEKVLKAQGFTSAGPTPALGIFETILSGSAGLGTPYVVRVLRKIPSFKARSFIRVVT